MAIGSKEAAFTQRKPGLYQSLVGEDRWLEKYFGSKAAGFFIEVGAYDGVILSNTYFFEQQLAWTGILVEPDPAKAAECRVNRPQSTTYAFAAAEPGVRELEFSIVEGSEVLSTANMTKEHAARVDKLELRVIKRRIPAMTVDEMIERAPNFKGEIDFVSIDVEEGELSVLRGFDLERWKPKLVMIENNLVYKRDPAVRRALVGRGYAYLRSIEFNDVYVPSKVAGLVDSIRYPISSLVRRIVHPLRQLYWRARKA